MMVLGEDDRRQPRLWEILRQSGVKMIVGNLLMEIEMTSTVGNIQVMKKSWPHEEEGGEMEEEEEEE